MSSKLNEVFIFLGSINFAISSAQVLKEPTKDRKLIWQILLHVAKWCRGLKSSILLERVNPKFVKWLDVRVHESSVKWSNEIVFLKTLSDQLRIPLTLMDVIKPQREKMVSLIDRLRQYGLKRRNILKGERQLLSILSTFRTAKEKLLEENNRAKIAVQQIEAKRKLEKPQCDRIIAREKELKISLDQIRQTKELTKQKARSLAFKREQLRLRLSNKRAACASRQETLELQRAEYLKCLPNIEELLASQKKSEVDLYAKLEADMAEKANRYNSFSNRIEVLGHELDNEFVAVEEASRSLTNNIQVLQSIAAITDQQRLKQTTSQKLNEQSEELKTGIANLTKTLTESELYSAKMDSDTSSNHQTTSELKEKFAREVASMSALKETKRMIQRQEKRISEQAEQVRQNFLQREEKLKTKLVEYTTAITGMIQSLYKDVREINRASQK